MNKKRVWRALVVLITVMGFIFSMQFWMTTQALESQTTQAGVPTQISYQGYLVDEAGQPINGSVNLQFNIFAEATGATSLWQETHDNVPVSDGYFAVYLGATTPLNAAVFNQPTRYLQVGVDTGDGLLTLPHQQFVAVPYALQAEAAAQVPWSGVTGLPPNLADGDVWSMHGNAGTNPNAHFLGTTDAVSLTLAVSGTIALRLEPAVHYYNGEPAPNVILGAESNRISNNQYDYGIVIGGGYNNTASRGSATVSGGYLNTASGYRATVSGGSSNTASGLDDTVSGGYSNTASGSDATVSGGYLNTANGPAATVSGGAWNTASNNSATVSGGLSNTASGYRATVSGGDSNTASDNSATVSGGLSNTASGYAATVSGGDSNTASGAYSFAAGRRAHAGHDGAFVWADNQEDTYASTAENQFAIRASGGVTLAVNAGEDKPIQVGERYRDNALIAWGRVSSNALLDRHFGIAEVSQSTTGQYVITLDAVTYSSNGAALIPMAVTEIDTQPTNAAAVRFVSINQTSSQTFEVYINDGNFNPVNNDFVFMVTGR